MKHLSDAKYVSIRTFKSNGDPVATPVWPAVVDDLLYFGTPAHTHKVKRIERNPRVEVADCDSRGNPTGLWVQGTARLLSAEEFKDPKHQIDRKHRLSSALMKGFARIRRWEYLGVEVRVAVSPPQETD